jgi:hypothetical protein
MERPACHYEFAFTLMMNRPGLFPRRVKPRLDDFEDEEIVFRHQLHIHDLAFQASVTFGERLKRMSARLRWLGFICHSKRQHIP